MVLAHRLFGPIFCCVLLAGQLLSAAQAQIASDKFRETLKPTPGTDIYDYAKLLDGGQKANLEEICRGLRKDKRAQLVVVTVPDMQGGEIDDFTNKLFRQWKIGDNKADNGVLLLIAMQERKARIETGYGEEGAITDGQAKRLLNDELFPRFKKKEYAAGLTATVTRLAAILNKTEPPPKSEEEMTGSERAMVALFLTIFVGVGSLMLGGGIGGRQVALVLFGLVFAGFPFLIGAVMAAPYAPIFHLLVAIPAAILGWSSNRNGGWTKGQSGGKWGGGSSGGIPWDWGGMGGGSSFGGGSSSSWSGGGFSSDWGGFGGGSSGGGGASGGW